MVRQSGGVGGLLPPIVKGIESGDRSFDGFFGYIEKYKKFADVQFGFDSHFQIIFQTLWKHVIQVTVEGPN